jgi:hypothetical protein
VRVPPGELPAARALRIGTRKAYTDAIRNLQADIEHAYKTAHEEATAVLSDTNAIPAIILKATAMRDFYQVKQHEVVQPLYSSTVQFSDSLEINLFMLLPLGRRASSARHYLWSERIDGDVIATMFQLSKDTVDVLTLINTKSLCSMWQDRLERVMDSIYMDIIVPDIAEYCIKNDHRIDQNIRNAYKHSDKSIA